MAVEKKMVENIVGAGNVVDDAQTLQAYAGDQSLVAPRRPDMVVFVETLEQVQAVVQLANETTTPVVPFSSGLNLHGATIPDQGGILLDMSRMNKILQLDEDNWWVMVEPGVTYGQLQDYLLERGFRIQVPFGVPAGRSVLTSYLERDPVLAAPSFENGNALIMDTELVLPEGQLFKTGNWASGGDPGAPNGPIRNTIWRMWTGAQGTLGIMTKMVIQIEPLPPARTARFIPCDTLTDALRAVKAIQLREIGTECFVLNRFNLAAMRTDSWSVPAQFPTDAADDSEFAGLCAATPPYVVTVIINGGQRRTEEKIAYEAAALKEVCDSLNMQLLEGLPNVPGVENMMLREMHKPQSILKKFNFKGSVQDLTFKAPITKVAALVDTLQRLAQQHGYPQHEIGIYLLPMERGRAIHCELDLHCPAAGPDRARIKQLWMQASQELVNGGAYFDRPYGPWADLMYSRAANYTQMLRKLKTETDPNNILNPGKLCFA